LVAAAILTKCPKLFDIKEPITIRIWTGVRLPNTLWANGDSGDCNMVWELSRKMRKSMMN